jgi:hypothetical protein
MSNLIDYPWILLGSQVFISPESHANLSFACLLNKIIQDAHFATAKTKLWELIRHIISSQEMFQWCPLRTRIEFNAISFRHKSISINQRPTDGEYYWFWKGQQHFHRNLEFFQSQDARDLLRHGLPSWEGIRIPRFWHEVPGFIVCELLSAIHECTHQSQNLARKTAPHK